MMTITLMIQVLNSFQPPPLFQLSLQILMASFSNSSVPTRLPLNLLSWLWHSRFQCVFSKVPHFLSLSRSNPSIWTLFLLWNASHLSKLKSRAHSLATSSLITMGFSWKSSVYLNLRVNLFTAQRHISLCWRFKVLRIDTTQRVQLQRSSISNPSLPTNTRLRCLRIWWCLLTILSQLSYTLSRIISWAIQMWERWLS
jgi:hypothetical protein